MPALADLQLILKHAVVNGDAGIVAPFLSSPGDPVWRLDIHRRHYEASLTKAIVEKFPATVWLVGSPVVAEAARDFVRKHPPARPCIAEYGADFPDYLASRSAVRGVAYLRQFAELEWHIGQAAIAVDDPVLPGTAIVGLTGDALSSMRLSLQSGLHYCNASWPVDDLFKIFLTGSAPERLIFEPEEIWLEVRGARGEFRLSRLGPGDFTFRKALHDRQSVGDAAQRALGSDPGFNPGDALLRLLGDGLAVAAAAPGFGDAP